MRAITKFSCYDRVDGTSQTRTTYRIMQGEDNLGHTCYWIEQKSMHGKGWFKTFREFVHWRTLKELWNSAEFKCLFGQLSQYEKNEH